MRTAPRRTAPIAVAAVLGIALAGCSGSPVTIANSGPASAGSGTDGVGSEIALPPFPIPRVPDITTMTGAALQVQKTVGAQAGLPVGVQVVGARCNAQGQVVNRSGMTTGGGDDGSVVDTRAGSAQLLPDGSGQLDGGTVSYQVSADGSGQMTVGEATVQVDADGSGQYEDAALSYQVSLGGSGQYERGRETYQVSEGGSGQWDGPYGLVQNNGDGSGRWESPKGDVVVAGDGTGTLEGEPIKVRPMPKFALLGTFPKLQTLKPFGKPCGTLIRIPSEVLFDFDKATLRPEAKPVIAAVAKALAGSTTPVQVNGHTDALGTDAYNQDLSQRRAQAVVAALRAAGVTIPLQGQGFGESQPVAPNTLKGKDNPAGRQLNRRVEIVLPAA